MNAPPSAPGAVVIRAAIKAAGLILPCGAVPGTDIHDPDWTLLAMIVAYTRYDDESEALIKEAKRYKPDSRKRRALWHEALSTHDVCEQLRTEIARTKPVSATGLYAKLVLALEQMDRKGDGRVGTIWELPVAAMRGVVEAWGTRPELT